MPVNLTGIYPEAALDTLGDRRPGLRRPCILRDEVKESPLISKSLRSDRPMSGTTSGAG
jgi:hypothetical protein